MNPLDTLKTGALGVAEKVTGENPKLLQETIKLVQNMPDGLTGLVKQFQDKGLGQLAASFTGAGPKQEILPAQILQGFGSDKINALATATGIDPKLVPEQLVAILPKVFEKLTPLGKLAGVK